jgi:hypothetical protein
MFWNPGRRIKGIMRAMMEPMNGLFIKLDVSLQHRIMVWNSILKY